LKKENKDSDSTPKAAESADDKKRKKGKLDHESNVNSKEEVDSKEKKIKANPKKEEKASAKMTEEREKIIVLIDEALNVPVEKKESDIFFESKEIAAKIEQEIFYLFHGTTVPYKNKCRSIIFNLKNPKNPDLRSSVLEGAVTPKKLPTMTPQEMASNELKKKSEKIFYNGTKKPPQFQIKTPQQRLCFVVVNVVVEKQLTIKCKQEVLMNP